MRSDNVKSFVMGSISGTISAILFQPLDVTKTRFQDLSKRNRMKISYIFVFKNIYHTEGITGFWKGLAPTLMRCIPGVGMYFCTLNFLNENIVGEKPTVFQSIMMGAVARTCSTVCLIPFTVLKTRFESGEYNYKGLLHAFREVHQIEGFQGFTRGLTPTIVRDVPFSGVYYLFYSRLKRFAGLENSKSKPSVKVFICGITAGSLASIITHPADVIKTYMQLYPSEFSRFYSGLNFIYQKFGVAGYFNGLIIRLLRRSLVTSLSWTVYERINEWNKMN